MNTEYNFFQEAKAKPEPMSYRWTILLAIFGGLSQVFIENHWLPTSVPIAGQNESDPLAKTFLGLAFFIRGAVQFGAIGLGVDYAQNNNALLNALLRR